MLSSLTLTGRRVAGLLLLKEAHTILSRLCLVLLLSSSKYFIHTVSSVQPLKPSCSLLVIMIMIVRAGMMIDDVKAGGGGSCWRV